MNKFTKKIVSVISAGALVAQMLVAAPAFATTITISGNGDGSTNNGTATVTQTTTVVQSNDAKVDNNVTAKADSGDNSASHNTGGNVSVSTGNANTDVKVDNKLNSNSAQVDCCPTGDTTIKIAGNGSDSKNDAKLTQDNTTSVFQENKANVDNDIYAKADSGDNKAKYNTGGDVTIDTGDAKTNVDVSTTANANWAKIGGNGDKAGSVSLKILSNGDGSDNGITLDLTSGTLLAQSNEADIKNDVYAKADTGDNEAKHNTGGDVSVDTGNATADVTVDNAANFNWADSNCGCLLEDLGLEISGNGDSDNTITATLGSGLDVFQGNCADEPQGSSQSRHGHHGKDCEVNNDVTAKADSGDNSVKYNTGTPAGGDPSIDTGSADSGVEINNSGYVNKFGGDLPANWPNVEFQLPDMPSWAWFIFGFFGGNA